MTRLQDYLLSVADEPELDETTEMVRAFQQVARRYLQALEDGARLRRLYAVDNSTIIGTPLSGIR